MLTARLHLRVGATAAAMASAISRASRFMVSSIAGLLGSGGVRWLPPTGPEIVHGGILDRLD